MTEYSICAWCDRAILPAQGGLARLSGNVFHRQVNVCVDNLRMQRDAAVAELAALDWQPGSEPPPQPGQYEVASRRDRFNGLGERAPGAGPWFYEHRNWTGKRWMAGDAAAAVLWWRVVPPIPGDTERG